MSNAKQKRAVAAHIEWRNREMPSNDVTVTRPHERTFIKTNQVTVKGKNGKPKKRKAPMVSWRKYETTTRATLVDVASGFATRPNYDWKRC